MIRINPTIASLVTVCALTTSALAQEGPQPTEQLNCTQVLRAARVLYDEGRLHELQARMAGCLNRDEDEGGFSKSERIEAFKILTLAHIYLEEPTEADASMLSLLNTDPFVKLDTALDPIELHNLYRKFNTDPVFMIGGKIGFNTSHVNVTSNHYLWMSSMGKGTYRSIPSIQYAIVFEKAITADKRIVASPEVMYATNAFEYSNTSPLSPDRGELGPFLITQKRLQVNLIAQYRLTQQRHVSDRFIPFVAGGASVGYLMASELSGTADFDESVSRPPIANEEYYEPIALSAVAMAGVKIKLGASYLTADARFQYGVLNAANKDNRFRWEGESIDLLDLGFINNDFTLSHIIVNIGLTFPRFKHIKLTH